MQDDMPRIIVDTDHLWSVAQLLPRLHATLRGSLSSAVLLDVLWALGTLQAPDGRHYRLDAARAVLGIGAGADLPVLVVPAWIGEGKAVTLTIGL